MDIDEVVIPDPTTSLDGPTALGPQTADAEGGCGCGGASAAPLVPIYAVGEVDVQFPHTAIQREYEHERAALTDAGDSEQQRLYEVLGRRPDLARALCWTLKVQGIDAYHLVPRSRYELDALVEALKPVEQGRPGGTDVIVGWRAGISDCGGAALPTVVVETSYSFDAAHLIRLMTDTLRGTKRKTKELEASARELFERIRQIADNLGEQHVHRALNYLAVRFAPMYDTMASAAARDLVLMDVLATPSRLSTETTRVIDVVLSFKPRRSGACEHYRTRVDVSHLYPYPVASAMQPCLEPSA